MTLFVWFGFVFFRELAINFSNFLEVIFYVKVFRVWEFILIFCATSTTIIISDFFKPIHFSTTDINFGMISNIQFLNICGWVQFIFQNRIIRIVIKKHLRYF